MKKTNSYIINHLEEAITMTKEFAQRAGTIDSNEYRLFTQFRKDFPTYKIEVRTAKTNADKNTYKGLSLENMEKYLATRENAADALKAFEAAKEYYKSFSAYYSKVKAWFLSNYKEDFANYTPAASIPAPAQNTDVTPINTAA